MTLVTNSSGDNADHVYLYFNREYMKIPSMLYKYKFSVFKNLTEESSVNSVTDWISVTPSSTAAVTIGNPFLSKAQVLDTNNKFLDKNGALTIRAEVEFHTFMFGSNNDNKCPIEISSTDLKNSKLLELIENLYTHKSLSDMTLVVKKEKIPAHKIVLSAHSKYFARLFEDDSKKTVEKEIKIPEEDEKLFMKMLSYFYSKSLSDLNSDEALDLLVLANKVRCFLTN